MVKVEEGERLPPGFVSPYTRLLAKEKSIELQKAGVLPSPNHGKDIQNLIKERYFTTKALELLRECELSVDELLKEFPDGSGAKKTFNINYTPTTPIYHHTISYHL